MLLSFDHAASGTDLTEASHIVLLDPIIGTQARIVGVEQRAIGRAHRTHKRVSLYALFSLFFV